MSQFSFGYSELSLGSEYSKLGQFYIFSGGFQSLMHWCSMMDIKTDGGASNVTKRMRKEGVCEIRVGRSQKMFFFVPGVFWFEESFRIRSS